MTYGEPVEVDEALFALLEDGSAVGVAVGLARGVDDVRGLGLVLAQREVVAFDNVADLVSLLLVHVLPDEDSGHDVEVVLDERLLDLGAHLQVGLLPRGRGEVKPAPAQLVLELVHGGQDPTEAAVRQEVEKVSQWQSGLGHLGVGGARSRARGASRLIVATAGAVVLAELDKLGDELGQGFGRRWVRGHMLQRNQSIQLRYFSRLIFIGSTFSLKMSQPRRN